mgnify:CR=1 FL=1
MWAACDRTWPPGSPPSPGQSAGVSDPRTTYLLAASLSFVDGQLVVGCDDGVLRVYGPDGGLVRERAEMLARTVVPVERDAPLAVAAAVAGSMVMATSAPPPRPCDKGHAAGILRADPQRAQEY